MVVCSNALNQFVILCRFFKVSSVKIVVLIRLDFHCSLSGFLRDLSTSASCCRWGSTTSELLQMRLWSFSDSPQVQWVFFLRTVEVQIPVVICWKWKEQTYSPKFWLKAQQQTLAGANITFRLCAGWSLTLPGYSAIWFSCLFQLVQLSKMCL